ncbi:helix-turn-helix transcriptional regulator [Polaromonas sp.]|uniref:helix-turn-helix transcriptional regulator n=1 Tax=Polaromonas sp. TaxID=1869339 RepID=UPI00286AC2E7|nr:helix-turn-helix transcriptional regulator [Polaromonas sp.]
MTLTRPLDYDQLLGPLYDAVTAADGFQSFIDRLRIVFQLKAAGLMTRSTQTQEIKGLWMGGISHDWQQSYVLDYGREDMLVQHIMSAPIAHFYASNLDVPHPEHFAQTRFFREWVVPQGVAYGAGAVVLQEGDWQTQLLLQRATAHPPFVREELDQLNLLVPHLQRAIQMRQRFAGLQVEQNFLVGRLDVLPMPILLFDEYGLVAHYNRSAAAMLAQRGGLQLHHGHLQTPDDDTTRQLNLEVANAIRASRGDGGDLNSVVLIPRPERLPLMLMVAPLQLAHAPQSHGGALLFAFDPETTPRVTADTVRRMFTLSEAEAELAVALCCGKSLEDAARARGTSINTIKSQLKSTFVKTGTKRQSELVSLLLTSPAYFLTSKQPAE